MNLIKNSLPQPVKNALWSYNTDEIDLHKDRSLIVSQVLNYGCHEATDWLFATYSKAQVRQIAIHIPLGQWDKKSLALWKLFLGIRPVPRADRINHAK